MGNDERIANIELHVHPYLDKYGIDDVIAAMDRQGVDIVALPVLNGVIHNDVLRKVGESYGPDNLLIDQAGIRLPSGEYLLHAHETNTKENLHVLTVGYSPDEADPKAEIRRVIETGLEKNAIVLLDHILVDNGKTGTAGHISAEKEEFVKELCREYSGEIALEWNGYCKPWVRKVLQEILNAGVRFLLGTEKVRYHDVNEKVIDLATDLHNNEGYKNPIVTDTDLHARNKRLLNTMGKAGIRMHIEGEAPTEVVQSMKTGIFNNNYQNTWENVSLGHLMEAFCLPILLRYDRPRGQPAR